MRWMAVFLVGLLSLPITVLAQQAKTFQLTYRFTLNGQYLGNVTDTFVREDSRYRITSIAKPEGKLAFLLPTLTLNSEGEFHAQQFRPHRFSQSRSGAPEKTASAEFDWNNARLNHQYKSRTQTLPLPAGTLDALSQLYSFTQIASLPPSLELSVTNGRKLMRYRYERQPPVRIEAALGEYEAVEYRRIAGADENAISVWIAPSLNNLPLRVRVREESGVFDQQLIDIRFP